LFFAAPRTRRAGLLAAAALALSAPAAARAQSVQGQEGRLIDVHSLLLDLPPLQAPAALEPGTIAPSVEAVFIPHIDGRVGDKQELTASDHTPVFPRPRLMLGLPAPQGFRAFVGLAFIPPITVASVSTTYVGGEAGIGIAPGTLRLGLRVHGLYAETLSPVTDPTTRDLLTTREVGADAAVGVHLGRRDLFAEPYLGAGVVSLAGRFHVTVDGNVLHSTYTGAALQLGVRTVFNSRLEVVGEVDSYPGRFTHGSLRVGWLFGP
jgi:hypothetical protein